METEFKQIGCILMASGKSRRYGSNKLLAQLGDRAVILHTAAHLKQAGLDPLIVTRDPQVYGMMQEQGFSCVIHSFPMKSQTMHVGLYALEDEDYAGYLFMPGDQPLLRPETIQNMVERFLRHPEHALRLGFSDQVGSPVIFPASLKEALLSYRGDSGGSEVLRTSKVPCEVMQANHAWELWDVDTPADMERITETFLNAGFI